MLKCRGLFFSSIFRFNSNLDLMIRSWFHLHFMWNFYVRRSRKAQKIQSSCLSFLHFWDLYAQKLCIKCCWNWTLVVSKVRIINDRWQFANCWWFLFVCHSDKKQKRLFQEEKNHKRFKNGFIFIHFILVLTTQNEDNKLKMKSKWSWKYKWYHQVKYWYLTLIN